MFPVLRAIAAGIFVILVFTSTRTFADSSSPKGVVERLQHDIFGILKQARALGIQGRYRKLGPVLRSNVHMPLMAATASAPFWQKASKPERERIVAAFADMHTALLAGLFDEYSGETYRTGRERRTKGPTVLVDSQIFNSRAEPTDVTFVTARLGGRWWVIDIVVSGGISEVKVRRNEYRKLLLDGGMAHLTKALRDKATALLSGKEKAMR